MKRFLLLTLLLTACTQTRNAGPARPEDMVRAFVTWSAEAKGPGDRAKLAGLCQGRMRKAFDGLSDDAFVMSYVQHSLKIKEFKILNTDIDGNLARVHYQVEVENPAGQDPSQEINEREVELLRVDGQWYLEAIRPKGSDQIAFTRGMIF